MIIDGDGNEDAILDPIDRDFGDAVAAPGAEDGDDFFAGARGVELDCEEFGGGADAEEAGEPVLRLGLDGA